MSPGTLYLDVDGVLADWTGAVLRLFGSKHTPADVTSWDGVCELLSVSRNQLWRSINDDSPHFWQGIDPFPDAHSFVAHLEDATAMGWTPFRDIMLCTAHPKDPAALYGRAAWLERYFPQYWPTKTIFCHEKWRLAGDANALLIDDNEKTCDKFNKEARDRGSSSRALLFPRSWNKGGRDRPYHVAEAYNDLARLLAGVHWQRRQEETPKT